MLEFLVEFLNHLFLVGIDLGVHDLLRQVVNLIVNLGEVTVNLIFPDDIMVEGLLFRAIPKLLVIEHELLCLRIVNDRGRGRIFLVDHWQVASWRLVYYVAILVKERQIFQDRVGILIVSSEISVAIFPEDTSAATTTLAISVDIPEGLMLTAQKVDGLLHGIIFMVSRIQSFQGPLIVIHQVLVVICLWGKQASGRLRGRVTYKESSLLCNLL